MHSGEGLGSFIKAWRYRLQPADVGLPAGRSRRTRGLRREELASLAGISVDYLVRLEQGRATSPSTQVLAALSRALRLTLEERDCRTSAPRSAALSRSLAASAITAQRYNAVSSCCLLSMPFCLPDAVMAGQEA